MTLTKLLNNKTLTRDVLKRISPKKSDFFCKDHHPGFPKGAPMLAPYRLAKPSDAGLVGAAADYLF